MFPDFGRDARDHLVRIACGEDTFLQHLASEFAEIINFGNSLLGVFDYGGGFRSELTTEDFEFLDRPGVFVEA